MKDFILATSLLFLTLAAALSGEPEPALIPSALHENRREPGEGILPGSAFTEFVNSLKGALERRDLTALEGLYQTNGVSAQQLNEELDRWGPMLEPDAKSRVSIQTQGTVFRDFNLSNRLWKHVAERLTTHKASHLVQLRTTAGYWMLPLVAVEGRLLIVPSDKSEDMGLRLEDVQDADRAANETQPVPSNTNSTSGAAGTRR